jgi:hypothetical protein
VYDFYLWRFHWRSVPPMSVLDAPQFIAQEGNKMAIGRISIRKIRNVPILNLPKLFLSFAVSLP